MSKQYDGDDNHEGDKGGSRSGQSDEDLTAISEEIYEKLKLLNYEKEMLSHKGFKPITKSYFAVALNPNEQFTYFKTLVKYLLALNDINSSEVTKYDDPMTVASNILVELKKLGIDCDFPPIKLKSGSGEQVCFVLLNLVNRALKNKKFTFKAPRFDKVDKAQEEEPQVDEDGDRDNDIGEDNIEISEEDPDDINERRALEEAFPDRQIIESNIDHKEWILEVERVTAKLKIPAPNDAKEWRNHIEQAKGYSQQIKKIIPDARVRLERMSENLGKILEKISKRERGINVNMNELGTEYKAKAEQLKNLVNRYNELNTTVKEYKDKYKEITEKFEHVTTAISEHGNVVTDNAPLVKIKTAIQKLREEITNMDLRIGVLSHTVMQHKFKEKKDHDIGGLPAIDELVE